METGKYENIIETKLKLVTNSSKEKKPRRTGRAVSEEENVTSQRMNKYWREKLWK